MLVSLIEALSTTFHNQGPRLSPTVWSQGGAASYERGTPVGVVRWRLSDEGGLAQRRGGGRAWSRTRPSARTAGPCTSRSYLLTPKPQTPNAQDWRRRCWCRSSSRCPPEREFFIDNLLVRIHFIIVMIRWTGLAP